MGGVVYAFQALGGEVGVYLGSDQVGVPEQFLHAAQIGARIERFGNVAQVRSVYETRHTADGPLLGRGVNYLMLYWDGGRWWITGAVWDDERANAKLPASWVGVHERAP